MRAASFLIVQSETGAERRALASPDMCICNACLRELFDPADRRYRYPFINCTNCGPRFTIIEDVPSRLCELARAAQRWWVKSGAGNRCGGQAAPEIAAREISLADEVSNDMCLGMPGQVVEILDDTFSLAKVEASGVKRNVNVSLVASEGLAPGDWGLIHVGFAMSKIDEQEAQETLKVLQSLGAIYTDELKQLHQSQIE